MAEDLLITKGTKEEQYESLLPQIKALLEGEPDLIANLANITGALKEQFNWLWVGFYLVKNDELVLGPFQGPVAVSYTHLRAHETGRNLVCRLLLEKKKQ